MKTRKTNDIKAILFDMVGVLLFKKNNYLPKTSAQINADKIERLYNHTDDRKLLHDIKDKLKLTDSEIKDALCCIPEKYEKFNPLWNILPDLKKKYSLAIINNGNALAQNYWDKRFDYSIFDFFVNSAIIGIRKPSPQIYLFACKKLNVKPQECLFMDNKEEYIKTAKTLGMKTIWWKPSEVNESFRIFQSTYT